MDHRFDRFDEAFAIIRGLLRNGHVDVDGRFHQARDCVLVPRGPRPQGPPIFLGTQGARMLRQAAAHADGWNAWFAWFGNTPEGLADLMARVDRACADVGRDPASLERSVALLVQVEPGPASIRGGPPEEVEPLRGSPDDLASALERFAREGIAHVQLVLDPITVGSIERMGPVLQTLQNRAS
jgi:alkanesulfonate monooxygenase SsuD/methylene tetrahydromethanopterin reductase-like flavin-dependent oxidoreductase (luciferase family)